MSRGWVGMGKIQGETIYTTLHVCLPPSSDAAIASSSLMDRWDLLQSPSGLFSLYGFRSAHPRH